jgi:hypothetical protein
LIPGTETVTITRRSADATLDDFGQPVYTETTITVDGCLYAPGGGTEPVDPQRDAVDTKGVLYLPGGTVVAAGDVFGIRGSEYVKDAPAQVWVSPFAGFDTGVVVNVRQRNG